MNKIFLLGIILGVIFGVALGPQLVEALYSIPPTVAIKSIFVGSDPNDNVTSGSYSGNVTFIEGAGVTITPDYTTSEITFTAGAGSLSLEGLTNVTDDFCTTNQVRKASGNQWICANDNVGAGALNDLSDVTITGVAYNHILQFLSGQWVNKLFTINTQIAANDFQITGINNQTGIITRNQFSVNTNTCSGTDKVSAVNNITGLVTCAADISGGSIALNDLTDVVITSPAYHSILAFANGQWFDKIFRIDTQSATNDFQIVGINNQTGAITRNQFSVNTQSAANDRQITAINNVTGLITRNTFSVNSLTCGGTDKISSINNSTGTVICTTDSTGAGNGGVPTTKKSGSLNPVTSSLALNGLLTSCTILATATYTYDAAHAQSGILSTTAVTDGINGGIHCTGTDRNIFRGDQNAYMYSSWNENKITTNRIFIGFSSSATHLPNNADTILDSISGAGLCIRTTDTIYQFCSNDGSGAMAVASLTTAEDTVSHFFEVYTTDAGVTWCGKLDGGTAVCSSTAANIPAVTTRMYAQSTGETDGGATNIIWHQHFLYVQNDK